MAESVTGGPVDGDRVSPVELGRLAAAGPVSVVVPDFADPCGSRKVVRPVRAALSSEVWDSEYERMTVGRWLVYFGGEYTYPMIMTTSAEAEYEITSEPQGTPGPCGACRALEARERVEPSAAPVTPALVAEARERGHDQGWDHANYVDNVSGVDLGWMVPDRFASVADEYRTAFEQGMSDYRDGED